MEMTRSQVRRENAPIQSYFASYLPLIIKNILQ